MKIYTKTGDEGMTSLVGGERVPKTHVRVESYGTVDELNSQIGLLSAYVDEMLPVDDPDTQLLEMIQNHLFVIGSYLATNQEKRELKEKAILTPGALETLEKAIDRIQETLPPFRAFLLPGGGIAASQAHVCRTVCRRAERIILRLNQEVEVDMLVKKYINRLSDYLFILARRLNIVAGKEEKKWNISCR
ncbi:MAG: cob(I)yrinic acid a,c-diamide adenosyltransferase [Bacteroidaceae bacterium]|jgi:cob(I)alamin adenosyltransferase|nr:cob(I)yrinic acid a,c-diamide adenosyltransferase [Bacteroidaceae bacterium]MBR6989010.1 cob(I)yrinic acid a,c-diamide adenosyltransferase [Bacteroidaceae bacterium]